MFRHKLVLAFLMSVLTVTYVPAQNASKPLSNDDVVSMVKAGLPTSTISGAIQSQDTSFDLSAAGLISLKKNGVSQPIIDAMLASASKRKKQRLLKLPSPPPLLCPNRPLRNPQAPLHLSPPFISASREANKHCHSRILKSAKPKPNRLRSVHSPEMPP